jgi:hypothetical protein
MNQPAIGMEGGNKLFGQEVKQAVDDIDVTEASVLPHDDVLQIQWHPVGEEIVGEHPDPNLRFQAPGMSEEKREGRGELHSMEQAVVSHETEHCLEEVQSEPLEIQLVLGPVADGCKDLTQKRDAGAGKLRGHPSSVVGFTEGVEMVHDELVVEAEMQVHLEPVCPMPRAF